MKFIKYGILVFIFLLTSCVYGLQTTTTKNTTTESKQTTIDLTGNTDFNPLLFGEKRIYNEEIKRQTIVNTNLDFSTIDYLFIEYSIYTVKGTEVYSMMVTKESIENGFINEMFKVQLNDQFITIETINTIKHLIVTPIKIEPNE